MWYVSDISKWKFEKHNKNILSQNNYWNLTQSVLYFLLTLDLFPMQLNIIFNSGQKSHLPFTRTFNILEKQFAN